jgi:hypothetical protein
MEISLFAFLRGLKKCAFFFRPVTGFAHNEISRKVLEVIEKCKLNRRKHFWKIDNVRLLSIVPAALKQEEMLEETCEKVIP